MPSALTAPPWVGRLTCADSHTDCADKDKPKPELGGMPLEILEKIVSCAVGDSVEITIYFPDEGPKGAVYWHHRWLPNVLLVSKPIHKIAKALLPKLNAKLYIDVDSHYLWDGSAEAVAEQHFKKLVGQEPDRHNTFICQKTFYRGHPLW
jgi:hypothetical protein